MTAKINCVCDLCGAGFRVDDPYGSATCPGCGLSYWFNEGMFPAIDKRHWQLLREFTGPDADTPLADLTDDQWRGLGFVPVVDDSHYYMILDDCSLWCITGDLGVTSPHSEHGQRNSDRVAVHLPPVTTLGRLRHLLAALGSGG